MSKYADQITKSLEAFQERFDLLHKLENVFKIFMCPIDFAIEVTPEILQLQLIDPQTSTELKHVFRRIDKLRFFSDHLDKEKFSNMKQKSMRIAEAMGPTYECKSFFSKLKIVKAKNRNRLTGENMTNELRCATTNCLSTSQNWVITFKSKCHVPG